MYKKCSDYKMRFCCQTSVPSEWGPWGEWSKCTKTCGGGKMDRERRCVDKQGNKMGCFEGGPGGDQRFRHQKDDCNMKRCPSE